MAVLAEQALHSAGDTYACYYDTDAVSVSEAQVFRVPPGMVWRIAAVSLRLAAFVSAPANYRFRVLGTLAGAPDSGTVRCETIFSTNDIVANGYTVFAGPSTDLVAGLYALAVLPPTGAMTPVDHISCEGETAGDPYSQGGVWANCANVFGYTDGAWTPFIGFPAGDLCFKLEGTTTAAPLTPPAGLVTQRRLVATADNKFWYEDI